MSANISEYQPYLDAVAACEVAKETYGANSSEAQEAANLVVEKVNEGYVAAGEPDPRF
jgi:hypothetical protein